MSRRSTFKTLYRIFNVVGGVAALYLMVIRPWHLKWGATLAEVERQLPGDEFIPKPKINATHALTIQASIDRVWPWIAQIGQGRGGFYSYEFIENAIGLDIRNADRIFPEFQHPHVGELLPFASGFGVPYAIVEPPHTLVIHGDTRRGGAGIPPMRPGDYVDVSWGWYLQAIDDNTTRFVERWRADWSSNPFNFLAYRVFLEPTAFIMERKMLLGIKARAEHMNGVQA
jgi:hypothetical protein